MAGDIEELPFRLNFQAASLHSGSVSFGRFEKEALSWERRSSFSHNTYLEEVKKFSKPGSVTEKKAYFEAHFRNRAHMKQNTSVSQSGTEYQSSENVTLENMNCAYDFGSFCERSYSARFDECPFGSLRKKEFEEPDEPPSIGPNVLDWVPGSEEGNLPETYQIEPSINNETELGVNQDPNADAGTSEMTDFAATGQLAEEDSIVTSQDQVKTASQPKAIKSNIKSRVIGVQGKRNTSNGAAEDLGSKPSRGETDIPLKSEIETRLSKSRLAITRTSNKMQKHEVPHNSVIKPHHLTRSADLESRKRSVFSLCSASTKMVPKPNPSAQMASRTMRDFSSTKPAIGKNGSPFSFKSEACAEKRKELAEKVHRKESEKHQLRTKGEDTSSYRKSSKPRSTTSSSGIDTSERFPSRSEAGTEKAPSAGAPLNKSGPRHVSEATSFPRSIPSRSRAHCAPLGARRPSQAEEANLMIRKKGPQTQMHTNLQKHKVSEDNKVIKGQKIEGKPKMGPGRSNTSVIRKDTKEGRT